MKNSEALFFRKKILSALVSCLFSPWVMAAPTGGAFVVGGGTGASILPGADTVVTAAPGTNNSVINWGSFNVGSGESVTFQHGGAAHAFINVDQQLSASLIQGVINGVGNNTSVFLINKNGVQLNDATINVTGSFNAVAGHLVSLPSANSAAGSVTFTGSTNNVEVISSFVNASGNGWLRGVDVTIDGSALSFLGDLTIDSSKTSINMAQINAGQYFEYSGDSSSLSDSSISVNDQIYLASGGEVRVRSSDLTSEVGHIRLESANLTQVTSGSTLTSRRPEGDDYYDLGVRISSGGLVEVREASVVSKAPIELHGSWVELLDYASLNSADSYVQIDGVAGVVIGDASIDAGSSVNIQLNQYEVVTHGDIAFHGRQELTAQDGVNIYNGSGGDIVQLHNPESPEYLGISAGYVSITNDNGDVNLKRGNIVGHDSVAIYGENVILENSYIESLGAEETIYLDGENVGYESQEGGRVSQIAGKNNNINSPNVVGIEFAEVNVNPIIEGDFPYLGDGPSIEIHATGDGEVRGSITLRGNTVLKAGDPAPDVIVFAISISDGSSQYGDTPIVEYHFEDQDGNIYTAEQIASMTGIAVEDLIEFSGLPDETSYAGQYFFNYIGGLDTDGYEFFSYGNAQWDVFPRELTITAVAGGKTYGGADPLLGWLLTDGNLVNGDSLSGALMRDEGEAVGSYAIRQGSLHGGHNYAINFVEADFVITAPVVVPPPVEPPPVEPPPVEPPPVEPPPVEPPPVEPPPAEPAPLVERAVKLLVKPFVVFQNMVVKHDDTIAQPEIHANEIRIPSPQTATEGGIEMDALVEIEK